MNVLILSCGTRNKIVQYFRKEIKGIGKVVCTDMSNIAPALYEGDKYYIVPRMTDPEYMNVIFDICRKENITAIFSLIDPELSLLAANKEKFMELGVTVIGSSFSLCEMSLDKMMMYEWMVNHGYKTARSYIDKDLFHRDVAAGHISYPVFVKPVRGSASVAINKVDNKETIELLFAHEDNLMIQEYLPGQEIGVDVYIDIITGEIISIFTKKKIIMRAGETDKAVSFKDKKLFEIIEQFVSDAGYRGQIDIDVFDINGEYYISEVNPRFGGGYPHAYESGCNHIEMIIKNLQGKPNLKNIGDYDEGIYMMKYNEVMIKNNK
nr:ATP-grasp domain-containing protein [Clostridium paraputrificum]